MRLKEHEKKALVEAAQRVFGSSTHVWLFGSRASDEKRGGDIDLYVECDLSEGLVKAKIAFLKEISRTFGEQKVDVLIQSTSRELHPLGTIAKAEGIQLL